MNRFCLYAFLGTLILSQVAFSQEAAPPEGVLKVEKSAVPEGAELKAVIKEVRDANAADFKAAMAPHNKCLLARTFAQKSSDAAGDLAYAYGSQAIDLYVEGGDALGAFKVVDALALEFEIPVIATKAMIFKRAARKAQSPTDKRAAALVGMKLAADAATDEQYAVAKDVATFLLPIAKAAKDPAVIQRANDQLAKYSDALKSWQSVEDARKKLQAIPDDVGANETLGKYLCFTRQDWDKGLPLLEKGADPELKSIARRELQGAGDGSAQELAEAWGDLAERRKKERLLILQRCAYWLERAAPELTGVAKTDIEKRLQAVYEALSGRSFAKILATPPNGVLSIGITDCSADMVGVALKEGFAFERSWLLSLQFFAQSFPGGPHMVFSWADGRPGRDALMLGWNGETFGIGIEDCILGGGQSINFITTKDYAGRWVDVKVVHDTTAGELELYIDNRLIKRDPLTITPRPDIGMPLYLGGSAGAGYRYPGLVRNVWFGNIK